MLRRRLSWQESDALLGALADRLRSLPPFDLIVGVARGGLPLAVRASHLLDVPNFGVVAASRATSDRLGRVGDTCEVSRVLSLTGSAERVLVVDDVIGSGRTARAISRSIASQFGAAASVRHAAPFVDLKVIRERHPDLIDALTWVEDIDNRSQWIDFPWEAADADGD